MGKLVEPVGYYLQLTFSIITFCLLLNFSFCFTGKERWCSNVYRLLCCNKINVYTKWIYCFSLRTDILNVISKFDLHNIIVKLCHPNFTFLIHFAGWSYGYVIWVTAFEKNVFIASNNFPGGSVVESACNPGNLDSIHGSGRSPREGNGNLLQYFCLGNPKRRGTWLCYSPWGYKRVGHDWATSTFSLSVRRLCF